jgi:chromate transporter
LKTNTRSSLKYLFLTFLKIGATSFGGFLIQISVIQKQLVEKDRMLDPRTMLNGISLAGILPGPMATNLIAYIGYKMAGLRGAVIASLSVIFPAFVMILALTLLYFNYGDIPAVDRALNGVLPAVCAIILTVSVNMARQYLKKYWQWILTAIGCTIMVFFGGFFITIFIILLAAVTGIIIDRDERKTDQPEKPTFPVSLKTTSLWIVSLYITVILLFLLVFYLVPYQTEFHVPGFLLKIRSVFFHFSFVSVTLFGGGYVFIPALRELFVVHLHWLSQKEFIDGIALGQITPGPIMISATFIGYKYAGFWGAVTATLAIFGPPITLMLMAARFMDFLGNSPVIKKAFSGIHAIVIGMIFASVVFIAKSVEINLLQVSIFLIAFILSFRTKIDSVMILLLSGLAGLFMA